eukprot:1624815-Heterocapsa_arctica.AAC.1
MDSEDKDSEQGSGDEEEDAEEERYRYIEEYWRGELWAWAINPGMPADVKRRCVKELLAQWHPDKSRHRVALSKR